MLEKQEPILKEVTPRKAAILRRLKAKKKNEQPTR